IGTLIPILLPVLVVGLPLADFGMAIIRRTARGKSPFSPDREHLHHRMLDRGHSVREAVLVFYALSAIASLTMLLMYIFTGEDWFGRHWIGEYWIAVAYGVVGFAACLVLAIVPARPVRPAPEGARPEPV